MKKLFSTLPSQLTKKLIPPLKSTYVARKKIPTTEEQRKKILETTGYNVFNFPAMFTVVDYLSESGSSAMFDTQWASMMYGDESYGRNTGYYTLLESCRDVFERGDNKKNSMDLILTGNDNAQKLLDDLVLGGVDESEKGNSFVNGGKMQLEHPNAFLSPQGRCSEFILFSTMSKVLKKKFPEKKFYVVSNGFFDTTRANCANTGNIEPVDFFNPNLQDEFDINDVETVNNFNGTLDPNVLEDFIIKKGKENVPLVLLTITNNSAGGQPVSMKNIKEIKYICNKYSIPMWFDACRFSENAFMIKTFEKGYENRSIPSIIQEMFQNVDGFHISFKKDGLANIGGGLFFRHSGLFREKFNQLVKDENIEIGHKMKETQILTQGNDSYGGVNGGSLMSIARGLNEVTKENYLENRLEQSRYLAKGFVKAGIQGTILPPGCHAVYLDVNKFFPERKWFDFAGVGLVSELIKKYAVRACELGAFAFEFDLRETLPDPLPPNLVRFAIPRNVYSREHLDYTIEAVSDLYHNRKSIPNMKIISGKEVPLRHFVASLSPINSK